MKFKFKFQIISCNIQHQHHLCRSEFSIPHAICRFAFSRSFYKVVQKCVRRKVWSVVCVFVLHPSQKVVSKFQNKSASITEVIHQQLFIYFVNHTCHVPCSSSFLLISHLSRYNFHSNSNFSTHSTFFNRIQILIPHFCVGSESVHSIYKTIQIFDRDLQNSIVQSNSSFSCVAIFEFVQI